MNAVPTLLSIRDVCKITTLSRTAINKYRSSGDFPAAVELGEKRIAFVADEVTAWLNKRIAGRRGAAA